MRSHRVYAPGVLDERASRAPEAWPELPLEAWSDTYATLHLWLQIVGKIRHTLGPRPPLNHCWGDTLYVTAWGLTTSPIPSGNRNFEIDFDFIGHRLLIETGEGRTAVMPLQPQSVAAFYAQLSGSSIGSASTFAFTPGPTRSRTPSLSTRTRRTPRTTPSMRTGSGESLRRPTASSRNSARGSPASAAPCICSGAPPTSRSRGSPAGSLPCTPAACPIFPIA